MSKPAALTEAEIADIEMRLAKGWVIRAFEYRPLIAMARERNVMVGETKPVAVAANPYSL